jgi:multidrug resistance efflux pump
MTANPPSPRRSRWPIVLVVVIAIAIVAAVGVGSGRIGGPGADASAQPSASLEGVVPADAGVVAEGRAVPVRWAELVPGAAGRVAAIPVAVGDKVAEGDVVLQLDDEAAALEVESATAAYTAAQAATARAEASVTQAKANVTASGAAVAQAQAARRSADAARDQVPSGASKAVKRQADAQIDQAEAGVDSARAQRSAAQAAQKTAEAGLAAAQADEERAKLAVSAAELAKDHLAVTSPIAGTIVSVEPAVGDLVQPGVVVARVADASEWRFETSDLSESSIARVREGAAATVTVDGLPGEEIAGTVESVGAYGSPVQGDITYRVVVAPTGAVPEDLRWNMTVTIEIDGAAPGS